MTPRHVHRHASPTGVPSGFTLIEILIVAAIISLFSGLAIFSVQKMYDSARTKSQFAEAFEIGTSLSWARDDLGFYPRFHLLEKPAVLLQNEPMDTYGQDWPFASMTRLQAIINNWRGPYLGLSEARKRLAQGRSGLVTMVIPETGEEVNWPSDSWSRPYVLYLATTALDTLGNVETRFIRNGGEQANYFNAVVSYGPNGLPGNVVTNPTGIPGEDLRLFEHPVSTVQRYILKTEADLVWGSNPNETDYVASIRYGDAVNVGIRDDGSDDIFFIF